MCLAFSAAHTCASCCCAYRGRVQCKRSLCLTLLYGKAAAERSRVLYKCNFAQQSSICVYSCSISRNMQLQAVHLTFTRDIQCRYLTATEWRTEGGGFKDKSHLPFKRLPFHCCAISFTPFEDPVSLCVLNLTTARSAWHH